MDFELTMEQEILRKTVRDFAEKEIAPVARELDQKEEFSLETCRAMGELGLFGMIVADEYGGQGMDYVSYIIAVEELAPYRRLPRRHHCRGQLSGYLAAVLLRQRGAKAQVPAQAVHRRWAMGLWPNRAQRGLRRGQQRHHRRA